MSSNGKIIVLDGLDGSGKTTQHNLLIKHFDNINKKFKPISFPDYDKQSSALVKMYLNGEISKNVNDINAYAASSFYAVDRYANYKMCWENDYLNGTDILASRYVSSNAIHQMVKLDKKDWKNYLRWLEDYEYNKLGLPKADKVIFLDMPIEISQKMLENRYKGDNTKKDIHESNVDYLLKCRESALFAANELSWDVIKCSENGYIKSVEEINELILKSINKI